MESPRTYRRQSTEINNTTPTVQQTADLLQTVFDSAPNSIALMHPVYNLEDRVEDFTILLFNAFTLKVVGDIDYKGKRYGDLFPMVKPTGILEKFIEVFETGTPANFERWYTGEGMKHWFRFTAVKSGEMLVITTEDITDRKQAEEMMQESEERLSNIINQINAGIAQTTTQGQFINANERFCQITGYTAEDLRALTIKDLTHPEDWPKNEELVIKALTEGKNFFIEKRYIRKDGSIVWVNNSVSIVTSSKGEKLITAVSVDITDQVTNRHRLEESERHFRLMADTIPEIIWVTDAQGKSEFFNKRWEEFSGVPFEPSTAASVAAQYIHPDDASVTMNAFTESIKTGQPMEVEQRNRSASGEWRWFLNRAMPYYNPQTGEVEKWFGISTDIHEQKMAQQALVESESRLRALVNASSDVVYRFSADWKIMYPLDGKGFLLDAKAPIEGWMEVNVHPSEFDRVKKAIAEAIANKSVFELEHKVITVSGNVGWTYSRAVPLLDNEGNITEWFGTASDITTQKLTEQSLKESEERFRSMADASPVMIWTLDEAGNSTYYNTRAAEFTGHSEEEISEGKSWQVAIHADDIEHAANVVRNAVVNRIPYQMECRMQRADGEWRWLLNHGTPRFGKNGEYFGFVGSSIDITEHKESQQQLQTALEQIRLSKEAAELGTFDMDLEKGTMHWDDRCRTLFGISHHDVVTYEHDFISGLHPDDRERITKLIDQLFDKAVSNGDYDVEYRTVGAEDGVLRWVRAKGKVYFNEQDKPVRFIGSVLDITEKVTAIQRIEALVEERTKELAQANETLQKINKELHRSNQNLEEFAHAASHDLKEPVRKIHFYTAQLKEQLISQLDESQARAFNRIENASQRMGLLIDDLLLYSHVSQRPLETENVDLNVKVNNALEDLELDIAEKKAVVTVGKLPVVKGYRRQLQQLFQNLISNAVKYSKEETTPQIDISATEANEGGKAYHLISVKDNGIGFAPEYADKIFQMFTRLHGKNEYSGTGVGLSIVKKVVENHNGFIRVESEVGAGSVFKIYLPV